MGQCSIVGQLSVTYLIFVRVSSDSLFMLKIATREA